MFEQALLDGAVRTNRPWTTLVSLAGQTGLVGILLLVPLIFTDALPRAELSNLFMMPAPPPAAPPPPPPAEIMQRVAKVIPRQFVDSRLMAPRAVPERIAMIVEEDLPPAVSGVVGGVEGGVPGGMLHGVIGAVVGAASSHTTALPPPPPPPVTVQKPTPPQRIKVGGNVQEAKLIKRVIPSYPPLARQARVGGIVQLLGVITKEGVVAQLQVVSGHPLLVGAALEAVRQWVYEPTLLNGDKVEVIAPITVNFILQ